MNQVLKRGIRTFLRDRGLDRGPVRFHQLLGDGSRRTFWRIMTGDPPASFIAVSNPPDNPALNRENHACLKIGSHLYQKKVPVPKIHQYDLAFGWFIMEDLGDVHLSDRLAPGSDPFPTYENVLLHLLHLQTEGAVGFDPSWCWQTGRYDRSVMLLCEAEYFRDAFLLRYLGLAQDSLDLDLPFHCLAEAASRSECRFFLHRDFQSRNIMLSKGRIRIVDWQGGRLGPLGYDLASLLIDPYTRLSPALQDRLYRRYLDLVRDRDPSWVRPFESTYPYLSIQRNLQILGAFSHLTQVMRKTCFETYIPPALHTLHRLLHEVPDRELGPLRDLTSDLMSHKKILDIPVTDR
ncbi:MAG: phosphotransferase [Deltaproteobacteria bacterium]|nr:phosphotransferase [Deltaproteobacteria bacterium]